ncbi:cis-prenyltransferase 4, chloroplastic-like isoform X2 [Apium graveolens]|uniref:cis-prenyltransferase 4, chloroplastic-like isoform X2 n=1 Tax=Apium graveolens TaxID=4045 RepID=UPI003D79B7C1
MLSLSAQLPLTPSLRPDNPTHNPKLNSKPTHLRISTKDPIFTHHQDEFHIAGKKYPGAGDLPEDEKMSLPAGLRREWMPEHVAVIMDGNRRWARMRGLPSGSGYEAGIRAFRVLVELCRNCGIRVLTVFAFSSDNWLRPKMEVDLLLNLFETSIKAEVDNFMRKDIKVSIIGDPSKLPMSLQHLIERLEETTKHNCGLHLLVAVNYSGKYDIVQACQTIAQKAKDGLIEPEDINELYVEQELKTNCAEYPYPDLLIRTSEAETLWWIQTIKYYRTLYGHCS